MTEQVRGVRDLVAAVAAHAVVDNNQLRQPVSAAAMDEAERLIGFRLHPVLRQLYCQVADGGFGPDYTLLPLMGEGECVVGKYLGMSEAREAGKRVWPHGVVPILHWGCAMYAAVDCQSPAGTVLLFEPNAGPEDWAEAWFVDASSLGEWLETWIAGTGWYEPREDGPDLEMELWEAASARLAELEQ